MEKIITVGTKEVKMKSTAGTLTRYRMAFKRDLMKDLFTLKSRFERINKSDEDQFKMMDLQMFEQVAWALAKTAKFTWKELSFSIGIRPDTSIIVTIMARYSEDKLIYKRFYENSIDIIKIL